MNLRTIHRGATFFVVLFTLFLGLTGTMIQIIDMRSIFTHASPFDPNVKAMRESFDGPSSYQVISTADYVAQPLPANANLQRMLAQVMTSARAKLGAAPLKFVELRMVDGRAVGQVDIGKSLRRYDAASGTDLGVQPLAPDEAQPPAAARNYFKHLHRMTTFGDWALWINIAASLALGTLIVTGVIMYVKMLSGRRRLDRKGLFWWGGGWWRAMHRIISVVAAVFLVVVTLSGAWLAVESLGMAINMKAMQHAAAPRSARLAGRVASKPNPEQDDGASPLQDAKLQAMLTGAVAAYDKAVPDGGLRVIRLRWYGGAPQGGIVTGEPTARQLVYNAVTGQRMNATEPGVPPVLFPFGWTAHQVAKSIHRGDYFGLTGRFMDLFAGLAMIYLSVSGIVMYYDLWSRRRRLGRKGLVWGEGRPAAKRPKATPV